MVEYVLASIRSEFNQNLDKIDIWTKRLKTIDI